MEDLSRSRGEPVRYADYGSVVEMIDQELLDILRCPETHAKLRVLDPALVDALNRRIRDGKLKNRRGDLVTEPIEGGLIREDGLYVYLIRDGIPDMIVE